MITDNTLKGCYLASGVRDKCTGCGACAQICTHKALEMREDDEGFFYPIKINDLCVNCGLCEKICPVSSHDTIINKENSPAYMLATGRCLDYNRKSATIGVCTMIAQSFIEEGGIVFGALLDEETWEVKHIAAKTENELNHLRGSKYAQSQTGETFRQVKDFLKQGKRVLYIGTPCQIAGVKAFLMKDFENFYSVELVCHGVYSYYSLRKEIDYWGKKYNGTISNFKFRSKKKYRWCDGGVMNFDVTNKDGKCFHVEKQGTCSPTYHLYAYAGDGNNYNLRESCYSCVFRNNNRYGDLTVGDAWGKYNQETVFTKDNLKWGISLLLQNTSKGELLLSKIVDRIVCYPITAEEAFSQPAMKALKRTIPKAREIVYRDMATKEYDDIIREVKGKGMREIEKEFQKKYTLDRIKRIIKRVLFYDYIRKYIK